MRIRYTKRFGNGGRRDGPQSQHNDFGGVVSTGGTIEAVWQKAIPDPMYSTIRFDRCGGSNSEDGIRHYRCLGLEIDHIKPIAKGGTGHLHDLQRLHWENNRHKSDDYPCWDCSKKT